MGLQQIRDIKKGITKATKKKWLKKFSDKRRKLNKSYSTIARLFLITHPVCQIGAPGCTGKATEVHHKKGRVGKLLTDMRYFMASCRSCNGYVEVHDAWARKKGFKISRLRKVS